MGVKTCAALNCESKSDKTKGVTYHKFQHSWLPYTEKAGGLKILRKNAKNRHLCSLHFSKNSYNELDGRKKLNLKADAVPTIFQNVKSETSESEDERPIRKKARKSHIHESDNILPDLHEATTQRKGITGFTDDDESTDSASGDDFVDLDHQHRNPARTIQASPGIIPDESSGTASYDDDLSVEDLADCNQTFDESSNPVVDECSDCESLPDDDSRDSPSSDDSFSETSEYQESLISDVGIDSDNSDDVSSSDESILSEEAIDDHFPEIDKVLEGLCWSYEEKLSRLSNELKKEQDALSKERKKTATLTRSNDTYRVRLFRAREKSDRWEEKFDDIRRRLDEVGNSLLEKVKKVKEKESLGDTHATFVMDLLKNFDRNKNGNRWSQLTIKWCILFQQRSPGTYQCIRKSKLIKLPCRTNLQMYTGMSTGDVGVLPPLAIQRLELEAKHLTENEKVGVVIQDEMAVKVMKTHNTNSDLLMGHIDYGGVINVPENKSNLLANKLLAFLWTSLLTRKKIVVAYFPVRDLTHDVLKKLTDSVIIELYKRGFNVWVLVSDNLPTNAKAFRKYSPTGKMRHEVVNPGDPDDTLLLYFDPSHVIKNVVNQYRSRNLKIEEKSINFDIIKKLHDYQKSKLLRPYRKLTETHIDPTSIEKQNVGRSLDLVSKELIAALLMLTTENISGFQDLGGTIEFLKYFNWWFDFLNVCNEHESTYTRNESKAAYESFNDWRLKWLQEVFLPWLKAWKKSARKGGRKTERQCFSDQTYQALLISTNTAIALVRKVFLRMKVPPQRFYTSHLSGDPIELLYSAVRQMNGGNYHVELESAIKTLERVNRSGIVYTSIYCNVPVQRRKQDGDKLIVASRSSRSNEDLIKYLTAIATNENCVLQSLHKPADDPQNSVEMKLIAFTAGYVIHQMVKMPVKQQEAIVCNVCFEKINLGEPSDLPIYSSIRFLDRGGLAYPTLEFVSRMWPIFKFFESQSQHLHREKRIVSTTASFLLPWLTSCNTFKCDEAEITSCKHKKMLTFILHKFLKSLVTNLAKMMTDENRAKAPAENNKVKNRKLNTFSK